MAMSKNEMKDQTHRKEKHEAEGCSESIASLYDGKPSKGISIHARVPKSCFCDSFFLDHEYMFKYNTAQTQSAKALNESPGSEHAYFKYQQTFFEDHYRELEMLLKATDKNVIFMHTFRIPKSSIPMDGVIFV